MTATIDTTAGEKDYVIFTLTAPVGMDVSSASVVVGFGTWDDVPGTWITPGVDDIVTHPAINIIKVSLLCGAGSTHSVALGSYEAWGKATANPVIKPVRCGRINFV